MTDFPIRKQQCCLLCPIYWYCMMCHFMSFIISDSRCNQTQLHLHLHRPWCPSPEDPTSQAWCRWRGPPRAGEPAAGCQQWDPQLCGGERNTSSSLAQVKDVSSDCSFEGNSRVTFKFQALYCQVHNNYTEAGVGSEILSSQAPAINAHAIWIQKNHTSKNENLRRKHKKSSKIKLSSL